MQTIRRYDELKANPPGELAGVFHENTKLNEFTAQRFAERIGKVSGDIDVVRANARSARSYPGHARVELPRRFWRGGGALFDVMGARRTRRTFAPRPVKSREIARLLHASAGQTGSATIPGSPGIEQPLRASPSRGALHSIETYVCALNIEGLDAGLYHYHVPDHALEVLSEGALRDRMAGMLMAPDLVASAAAVLVLTGVTTRILGKYGDRGYRFLLLDAGHLAQNVLLSAEALGLAAVPLGGFHDDALNELLGIDGVTETALYPILLASRGPGDSR